MAILRLPRARRNGDRTIFVLGGGGNLGAIQVGMLQAVMERGILPDELVGCSVGAINAAAIAADPTLDGFERLRAVWAAQPQIAPVGRLDGVRLLTHRGSSLQTNDGLRQLLETHLPHRRFEDFAIPFHVVATSLRTGTERWFSAGDVIKPLLASAALPAVFPPVHIEGEAFIDGGVINNVPVSKVWDLPQRPTRVYVFHVGNFDRTRPPPKRPVDVLLHAFSISRSYRFNVEVAQEPPEGVEVVVLPSVNPGKLRYNDFGRSGELIERGRSSTAAFLDLRDAGVAAGAD